MPAITIQTPKGERTIGPGQPCFVIAEASSNHGNDLVRAKKLIDMATTAGADAVKFQIFSAETIAADTTDPRTIVRADEKSVFVDKDTKLIDLYKENELPREWLPELADYAREKGIVFLATPFDEEAVDQLEKVNIPIYKMASYELLDLPLLRKVAGTKKPIILSTGMADLNDIMSALEILKEARSGPVMFMHCSSIYPTPPEDINLNAMKTIQAEFHGSLVGYSDHSLGIVVPVVAVVLGASVIEKHFFLNDGINTVDSKFSLNPDQLKLMVESVRIAEKSLGRAEKKPSAKEEKEKQQARRSLWIVKDVRAGERLNKENIKSLRPGIGISSLEYDNVMGKKARKDIKAGTALSWNLIE